MKRWQRWFLLPGTALFALAGLIFPQLALFAQDNQMADLPIIAEAPELHEGIWLNTNVPLKLEALRGKVVLLEMWTFGCINCIRTLPYVREWHETYQDQGLVVIGNHYPEFAYESELANLRDAIIRLEVDYPVLQDNDRDTWARYNNRYWPTMYLIDKHGNIRYKHIGEGRYDETEEAIQALLAEPYTTPEPLTEPTTLIQGLTATEPLNVRSGPGIGFDRIGIILPEEAYYILNEQNGWYQIVFDGATAFVSADYVEVHEVAEGETIEFITEDET